MRRIKYILTLLFAILTLSNHAQKLERKSLRQGNKLYETKKFTEAEVSYRKALEVNPKSKVGIYNLGNALFKQEKYKQALEQYQVVAEQETNPLYKAAIQHNAGNVFMHEKDYQKAVDSFRASLRLNPNDDETRYNLAVAQALLKKDQQNNKDKKKDDKKDQKKDQDQKQKPSNQNNKQKQDQDQKAQEQVSKEKAKQLLDALSQDEKQTQDKVKKLQRQRSNARKTDKDW